MPTHASGFTGIGGFEVGFGATGFETKWHSEIDKFCKRVLKARWPEVPNLGNIEEVRSPDTVDVFTFGSPCQDLSVAGRRAGLAGSRSGLFFEAARVIHECRPAFAVWENVPGAFSSNGGRDFAMVLYTLRELGANDVAWRVFDSQYAGVPQQRRRIYLVADFRGRRAAEVLFDSESCGGHPSPFGEAGESLAATLAAGTKGAGRPGGSHDADLVSHSLLSEGFDASEDGTGRGTPLTVARALNHHQSGNRQDATVDTFVIQDARNGVENKGQNGSGARRSALAYTLDQVSQPAVFVQNSRDEVREMQQHPAVVSEPGAHLTPYVIPGIRRFTPVECERLQGFPDGWTCLCGAGGDIWSCKCPDGPRYRALGNACTTTVPYWLAQRFREIIGK